MSRAERQAARWQTLGSSATASLQSMQFEAVLASAGSKGDAPSRFELRSNPATDEVVLYVLPDPALPQKPRDYSHATRGARSAPATKSSATRTWPR